MRYGIIGKRSWIASALQRYFERLINSYEMVVFEKQDLLDDADFSGVDCLFLIAGRARPLPAERMAETLLVAKIPSLTRPPKKLVYLSSMAVEREPTPYAQMKLACEAMVLSVPWGRVLRAPVIFGPGQDPHTQMLIPQIAKSQAGGAGLVLNEPFRPFYLMHVDDVCHGAWLISTGTGGGERVLRLTSPTITPVELIQRCAPGTSFWALGGWKNYSKNEDWRPAKDGEHRVTWGFSERQVTEVIEHLASKLQMERSDA